MANRRWEFDFRAIHEFADAMGFTIPENVEFTSTFRGKRQRGSFTIWPSWARPPRIEVAAWNCAEQANRTLIHELCHLAQFVRDADGDPQVWARRDRDERSARHGYANRPKEVEAREWECLAETETLVIAR